MDYKNILIVCNTAKEAEAAKQLLAKLIGCCISHTNLFKKNGNIYDLVGWRSMDNKVVIAGRGSLMDDTTPAKIPFNQIHTLFLEPKKEPKKIYINGFKIVVSDGYVEFPEKALAKISLDNFAKICKLVEEYEKQ